MMWIYFVLHLVYLPIINQALQIFQDAWNRHSMSSEGYMSPYQMFFEGLSVAQNMNNINDVSHMQPTGNSSGQFANVPDSVEVKFTPCNDLATLLHTLVQLYTLNDSADFGKSRVLTVYSGGGESFAIWLLNIATPS